MGTPIVMTNLSSVPLLKRGKVRDIYRVDGALLLVATDRISAFDVVLPTPIPDKGLILTQLSVFWFERTKHIVPNHLITARADEFPSELQSERDVLEGRSMLVKLANPLPIECVVRGYITGSAWKEYAATGEVCGIKLPKGLKMCEKLPEPIFTPATKALVGHDENITFDQVVSMVGTELAERVKELSLQVYDFASKHAEERGIIIADTKFEFGLLEGELILIDELLTPDSSRFWDMETYEPGKPQESFDKQFVRDYLESINWDKQPPAPELPEDVVERTRQRYWEAYRRLCGD
ncbi:MAG: phosphoribosylaminoimidazolesuccinocarboxamide synthase [Armatimonadota bacterium]|nr:phosphoribosylaminoimidazolesuccinocarboxamide synthase [Armatimonadota bacterium]MCX7776634.1 phosphoribosylaminoimidazolesuccinocarboxamide synthase [Armatimonadota bacterium]MDW8025223.1 phosphoribosylaminoimidazolesuccinocarboxamide synthase [Armatimonadota bacterium]